LVGGRNLPLCGDGCRSRKQEINEKLLTNIASTVISAATLDYKNIPERFQKREVRVFPGHFTRKDQDQFIAYVNLFWKDNPGEGDSATAILDQDMSLVTILSQHQ